MDLEHKDLSRMLETAIVAARLAGQRAMEEMNYVKVSIKNSSELVTQADAQCQKIIIDRIKETYPDHGFIAEEGDQGRLFKQSPRGSEPVWWAIDPIDGTNNFANGMPIFAVSVAALHQGRPVAGAIYDPATDSMFTAVKDGEAQLSGRRITAGDKDMDEFSSVALDSHFPGDNGVPKWVSEIIRRTRFRNLGTTALQMAYVAKGSLVAALSSTAKLWDIAAGAIIAGQAEAITTDWQGRDIFPLDLDSYEGREFQVVSANKKVHQRIIDLIRGS